MLIRSNGETIKIQRLKNSIFHILDQIKVSIKDIFVNRVLPCFAMRVTWQKLKKIVRALKFQIWHAFLMIFLEIVKKITWTTYLCLYLQTKYFSKSIFLPTCLPTSMSTYLPTYPAQYLRIYLVSIFLPLNLSKSANIFVSIFLSISAKYLCIYLSIYLNLRNIFVSIYLSISAKYLCIYLSI